MQTHAEDKLLHCTALHKFKQVSVFFTTQTVCCRDRGLLRDFGTEDSTSLAVRGRYFVNYTTNCRNGTLRY